MSSTGTASAPSTETGAEGISWVRGVPFPLGAHARDGGYNFALTAADASVVELVLFDGAEPEPFAALSLDAQAHRTGDVWHALVHGLPEDFHYAYRVRRGRPSDEALLLDPYATGVRGRGAFGPAIARQPGEAAPRTGYPVDDRFDWDDDRAPRTPWSQTVIYELQVRGFTRHASAEVAAPGTFAALAEKIPYLSALGVTAVELLPVTDYEEDDCNRTDPSTGERLLNIWGYHPLSFMALKPAFAADSSRSGPAREFKALVKALHAAGLEVILDVVFNHTGEAEPGMPTYSWRGIDEGAYYLRDPITGRYLDFTGCGNTVSCNHAVVADLVVAALRRMVSEYRVDGFRFDLASVLCRGLDGAVLDAVPLVERIAADPVLADVKLIAEPWDASGFYQVGHFPGGARFAQWNDRFRDDVRRFVRGDPGFAGALAARLTGSDDLFHTPKAEPWQSINYVTCHDGFTLRDLFSYSHKLNMRNGEQGRDGTDANWSWNCGVEGETHDREVLALRGRLARNAFVLTLLASGTPMLLAGDEMGRTQSGNNNAYCHDSALTWLDWSELASHGDLHRFVTELLRFRRSHPGLRRSRFAARDDQPVFRWHGVHLDQPDWAHHSRSLSMEVQSGSEQKLLLIANGYWESLRFELPTPFDHGWRRVVDTALATPLDIQQPETQPVLEEEASYAAGPRSVVVLFSGAGGEG